MRSEKRQTISTDDDPTAITKNRATGTEGISGHIHCLGRLCLGVVNGDPGRMTVDAQGVVLGLIQDVDQVVLGYEHLLSRYTYFRNVNHSWSEIGT